MPVMDPLVRDPASRDIRCKWCDWRCPALYRKAGDKKTRSGWWEYADHLVMKDGQDDHPKTTLKQAKMIRRGWTPGRARPLDLDEG